MRLSRPSRRTIIATAGVGFLAACSTGGSDLPDRLEQIRPTDLPTPALTPRSDAPIDTRVVQGPGFTLAIPADWSDQELPPMRDGSRAFAYDQQGRPPERPVRVGVVIEDPAPTDAIEQSLVLVGTKVSTGAESVRRSLLEWPGALRAVLVDSVQAQPGASATPYRTRQLMIQVTSDKIVNVIAMAPADEYEALEVDAILDPADVSA